MVRFVWPALAVPLLLCGCLPTDPFKIDGTPDMPLVPTNPFGGAPAAPGTGVVTSFKPGSGEAALRVDSVGRTLAAANKEAVGDPRFATIGVGDPELFHHGKIVFVTEGLVRQCKTDGELAAVLSLELAKMVAEREAALSVKTRQPEHRPPTDVSIGNAGQVGALDGVHLAELGKWDKQRPKRLPPPDPQALARVYLDRGGFVAADLERVAPVMRTAGKNYTFEKQFKESAGPGWTAGEQGQ